MAIKIDVEGHDLAVLEGAERILREDRPALLVESSPVSNPAAPGKVFDFLAARGYVGLFLFRGRLTPLSAFRANIHQALGADRRMARDHVFNFVFLPGDPAECVMPLTRFHRSKYAAIITDL